jgi:hypothetical protein
MNDQFIRLYKFYSASSALRNLQQGRLKISRLRELNDPFEWNAIALASREDRKRWRELGRTLWSNKGIISFSDRWSNPVLWSHYADQHRGLCIGVDVDRSVAHKVRYVSKRIECSPLGELVETKNVQVLEDAVLTKFSHWKYETEWRVLLQIDPNRLEDELVFEPFSNKIKLAELIIGADSEVSSSQLRDIIGPDLPIKTARLAFRTFKIVEQRAMNLQK